MLRGKCARGVTIVAAETGSSEDFPRWAANRSVRGHLDRIVDECHLTFTAADEYRNKLRALAQLRNLGCQFVFLTGTLPPRRQREFEEAMLLQKPSLHPGIQPSRKHPVRCASRQDRAGDHGGQEASGGLAARRERQREETGPGQEGCGFYCLSHAKCKALALTYPATHVVHLEASIALLTMPKRPGGPDEWERRLCRRLSSRKRTGRPTIPQQTGSWSPRGAR